MKNSKGKKEQKLEPKRLADSPTTGEQLEIPSFWKVRIGKVLMKRDMLARKPQNALTGQWKPAGFLCARIRF